MRILGLIPARGGSKGIPRKNIKKLNGKPLIEYTFESAKKSKKLDKIIVSSDDDEIINFSKDNGISAPFKRPTEHARDNSSTFSVVKHVIDYFENNYQFFDAICLLQPTSPFRSKNLIDDACTLLFDSDADSIISVKNVPHEYNPHWVFEKKEKGYLELSTGEKEIVKRRQELTEAFVRDGSVYVMRVDTIKKYKNIYGQKILPVKNQSKFQVNIDDEKDWENAEDYLCAE